MGKLLHKYQAKALSILLLTYFALFVFGQIFKLFFGFQIIDMVVLTIALLYLLFNVRRKSMGNAVGVDVILVGLFTFVLYLGLGGKFDLFGLLYLIRFGAYIVFSYAIHHLIGAGKLGRAELYQLLINLSVISAFVGVAQYLILPDMRWLRVYGWDDHLNRLIFPFLDPAFTGIIFVLGLVLVINKIFSRRHGLSDFFVAGLLSISLLLTYSRSSYLAFVTGVFVLAIYYRAVRVFIVIALGLLVVLPFLPRGGGVGVDLGRTHSVFQKIDNYKKTWGIISESPLFGVGFNNLCSYRPEAGLNSCFGVDNSFLFILATTGAVGGIFFTKFYWRIVNAARRDFYGKALTASMVAVGVHSLFTNTMFYIFVLGWMGTLVALGRAKVSR